MAETRGRRRKKKQQSEYFFDYSLLFIVLFLLGFGLIMIYSASSYEAYDSYGDAAYYMKKQLIANIIGLVFMMVIANIPYTFWERFATLGYVVSMILIFLVKTPLGITSHGATRWIGIPHTGFNLQPAEVAKLCMILFLASLVCKMGKSVRTMKGFFTMMAAPLPIAASVYLITDNLSSAIIIMGIAVLMVFVASPDYKKFIIMGGSVLAAAGLLVVAVVQLGDKIGGKFRLARIQAWLNPESQAQDKGFEELGLFGAVAIILMFIMLLWRMMVIANNAPDLFGAMLVVGVMGHIAIQAILNIAVVTNSIPNTGISLPFISYGGSSALFLLSEIGLVLSVARRIQLKEL